MGKGKKQESQRHTDRQTKTNRQTDKQTDRLTDRQTNRQTDYQTDRLSAINLKVPFTSRERTKSRKAHRQTDLFVHFLVFADSNRDEEKYSEMCIFFTS